MYTFINGEIVNVTPTLNISVYSYNITNNEYSKIGTFTFNMTRGFKIIICKCGVIIKIVPVAYYKGNVTLPVGVYLMKPDEFYGYHIGIRSDLIQGFWLILSHVVSMPGAVAPGQTIYIDGVPFDFCANVTAELVNPQGVVVSKVSITPTRVDRIFTTWMLFLKVPSNATPSNTWVPLLVNYNAVPWTWESAYEGGKIVEKKKIGDDEKIIAYYIPYSVDKKRWGIYIKKGEVMQEIKFLDKEFKAPFGMTYLSLILLHELTHHVIEDWRVSTDGVFTYNKEDENLCEYTAFTLTEAIIDKFNIGFLVPNSSIPIKLGYICKCCMGSVKITLIPHLVSYVYSLYIEYELPCGKVYCVLCSYIGKYYSAGSIINISFAANRENQNLELIVVEPSAYFTLLSHGQTEAHNCLKSWIAVKLNNVSVCTSIYIVVKVTCPSSATPKFNIPMLPIIDRRMI